MTRTQVQNLISCEKVIKNAPKKTMYPDQRNNFSLRNDFSCVSVEGKSFEVYMRMNTKLPYLFSIGLRYRSENGSYLLCRYNGKHIHRNKIANSNRFNDFHIHMLYDEQLSDGTDDSLDAERTKQYATFNEALYSFLIDCHIIQWEKFFPELETEINQLRFGEV